MKRDECDGALHEIPMREAPQRSKCYILISTVTLCCSPYSPEGHIMKAGWTHGIMQWHWPSRRWLGGRGGWMDTCRWHLDGHRGKWTWRVEMLSYVASVSPACQHTVCIFGHRGGQRQCLHDSDKVVSQRVSQLRHPCSFRDWLTVVFSKEGC